MKERERAREHYLQDNNFTFPLNCTCNSNPIVGIQSLFDLFDFVVVVFDKFEVEVEAIAGD